MAWCGFGCGVLGFPGVGFVVAAVGPSGARAVGRAGRRARGPSGARAVGRAGRGAFWIWASRWVVWVWVHSFLSDLPIGDHGDRSAFPLAMAARAGHGRS